MPSLMESLAQSLTPDIMGQIGKATGLDLNQTTKGVGIVGPLITGALANRASTADGLSGLMGALSSGGGSGLLDNVSNMISGGGAPASMMSGLFGSGISAMGGTIDRALGFKVSPLLAMAAPFVVNQLSQRMTAQKLDNTGVATLLRDEQAALASKTDQATAGLVRQALDAGRDAAATKARYLPDQWNDVRFAAAAVAMRVMGASPSGFAGAAKEVVALADTVKASKKEAAPTSILNLAFDTDLHTDDYKQLPDDGPALVNMVRRAMQAVSTHSPADAPAYGRLLVDAAIKVAEASKEGGFLGIGGTRVSVEEQQAIDEIRAAVGQVTSVA